MPDILWLQHTTPFWCSGEHKTADYWSSLLRPNSLFFKNLEFHWFIGIVKVSFILLNGCVPVCLNRWIYHPSSALRTIFPCTSFHLWVWCINSYFLLSTVPVFLVVEPLKCTCIFGPCILHHDLFLGRKPNSLNITFRTLSRTGFEKFSTWTTCKICRNQNDSTVNMEYNNCQQVQQVSAKEIHMSQNSHHLAIFPI